jgi:head-tail adaptor
MLSAADLERLRADYEATFQDACEIGTESEGEGATGQVKLTWSYGPEIPCGFDPTGGAKRVESGATPSESLARVRLAHDVAVTSRSRIRVTRRYGSILNEPLVFDLAGPPQIGPAGVVCPLKVAVP